MDGAAGKSPVVNRSGRNGHGKKTGRTSLVEERQKINATFVAAKRARRSII